MSIGGIQNSQTNAVGATQGVRHGNHTGQAATNSLGRDSVGSSGASGPQTVPSDVVAMLGQMIKQMAGTSGGQGAGGSSGSGDGGGMEDAQKMMSAIGQMSQDARQQSQNAQQQPQAQASGST